MTGRRAETLAKLVGLEEHGTNTPGTSCRGRAEAAPVGGDSRRAVGNADQKFACDESAVHSILSTTKGIEMLDIAKIQIHEKEPGHHYRYYYANSNGCCALICWRSEVWLVIDKG